MDPAYNTTQGGSGGVSVNWPSAGNDGGNTGGSIFNNAGDDDDDDEDLYS